MLQDEAVVRLEALSRIRDAGVDPYPARVERTHAVQDVVRDFSGLEKKGAVIAVGGRLRAIRGHGGMTFATLEDGSGRIQIAWKKDAVGAGAYEFVEKNLNIGDLVAVSGTLFSTKRGEKTLLASKTLLAAKALLPLPEKWHGLSDVEIRYRKRYLDLIANEAVRDTFRVRSALLAAIRRFFDQRGYLEVETPVLQAIPGGANARPFTTHHHALGTDLYLRIAPELYLKRLVVGGLERVYEIARCFRNEGIDHLHNPEFTQVEWYEAWSDYRAFMKQVEKLLPMVIKAAGKDVKKIEYDGHAINFTPPYPVKTFHELLSEHAGIDLHRFRDRTSLLKKAKELRVEVTEKDSHGKIMDEIYKTYVRPKLVQPTFLINHPVELSPLAKRKTEDPRFVERFQLVVGGGIELVNAFSELNDPLDQEERFKEQDKARRAGDAEAQPMDADYVEALKVGLPPTAGGGMGIDRLTALLTGNHSIKEVILFPTLKPLQ